MKKKLIAILLIATLLLPAWCEQKSRAASAPELNLYFLNNEAHCSASVRGSGRIVVQMELWHGNTVVFSWNSSGNKTVSLNETCDVIPGYTYTLKLNGTIGGVAFQEYSVTRTNYEMSK